MKLCELMRVRQGRSRNALSIDAKLAPSQVGWIETGRFVPYPVQLGRLAAALGYVGRPEDLLKDVSDLLTEVPDA
jgi:hypothetical protein